MRPASGSSLSLRALGVTFTVVAAIGLGACGGGGDDSSDGVASLGTGAAVATETTVAGTDQDKILAYTACLREQGLDVADPTFDADGNMSGGLFGPDSGIDPQSAEFQAAQEVCGGLAEGVLLGGRGGGNFDPEAMQQATLAYTECLRDQGLEVDDLDFSAQGGPGGGDGVGPGGTPPGGSAPGGSIPDGAGEGGPGGDPGDRLAEILGLDADDPTVAAALDVCAPVLEDAMSAVTSTTVAP
jgi:hypothetical protein